MNVLLFLNFGSMLHMHCLPLSMPCVTPAAVEAVSRAGGAGAVLLQAKDWPRPAACRSTPGPACC
jgi:hypothetical protein